MSVPLRRYRFTVFDYHRMAEAGILGEDDRVELIDGEIIDMGAIGSRHAGCVNRLNRILTRELGDRAVVGVQNPVRLSDLSEPQPDVGVMKPRQDGYGARHPAPSDVLLIIEVADSSLPVDTEVKAPLYATAGIPEFWIVDLEGAAVDVFRDPVAARYETQVRAGRGESVTPLAFDDVVIDVVEIVS
jgi:Uma2 family endonuclease